MTAPTRLTRDALEALSFAKNRPIEVDAARGLAVLTIGANVYCAELAKEDVPDDGGLAAAFEQVTGRILADVPPRPPKTDHDLALEDLAAQRAADARDEAFFEGQEMDRREARRVPGWSA